jgi:hypothetical protein
MCAQFHRDWFEYPPDDEDARPRGRHPRHRKSRDPYTLERHDEAWEYSDETSETSPQPRTRGGVPNHRDAKPPKPRP